MFKKLTFSALLLAGTFATAPILLDRAAIARTAEAALLAPSAERTGDAVSLSWTKAAGPVDIYLAHTPDAAPADATLVANAVAEGEAQLSAPASPRPYFILKDASGGIHRVAERVLPLEGGQNFRDLGGYRAGDGRTVRWGKLFRSGSMTDLTPRDFDYLGKLHIRTVCDFRSTEERTHEPVAWPEGVRPEVLSTDYAMQMGDFMQAFQSGDITAEKSRAMMAGFYRETPFQFAAQYRRMFEQLLEGYAPLAFNCSAGKDRTGVAAALLLTALDVPRETVVSDYLLSNRYFRPKMPKVGAKDPSYAFLSKLPPEVIKTMMGVDPNYIESAFAGIESRRGSVEAYFREDMGLDDADIARLRDMLLEKSN